MKTVMYSNGESNIEVLIRPEEDTVWLTQEQIETLFDAGHDDISEPVNSIPPACGPDPAYAGMYDLDRILSVGYRVDPARCIEFRKWAESVLRSCMLSDRDANGTEPSEDEKEVLLAVDRYTRALALLDSYDHQTLKRPDGTVPVYRITYDECRAMVDAMEDTFSSDVFGLEKEPGKVEGILAAVYQNVFGQELYPSAEEKAANLLYFMIKDHPFADGCKRIAASLFVEFLYRNRLLFENGHKILSDAALAAMTLMVAESDPLEKDMMVAVIMNLLSCGEAEAV